MHFNIDNIHKGLKSMGYKSGIESGSESECVGGCALGSSLKHLLACSSFSLSHVARQEGALSIVFCLKRREEKRREARLYFLSLPIFARWLDKESMSSRSQFSLPQR